MLKASKYEAGHKIRFLRVVIDDDVDRMQVYSWRQQSRALLIARKLSSCHRGWVAYTSGTCRTGKRYLLLADHVRGIYKKVFR